MKMQDILNNSWLTSDPIDYEYKKYLLLAYEQRMTKVFKEDKLYPHLTDIIDKSQYINEFIKGMKILEESSMELERIDWMKKELVYKPKFEDQTFDEIKKIARISQAVFNELYTNFKNLYDDVDGTVVISGSRYGVFDSYNGYIVAKNGLREKFYEYEIYKTYLPEQTYHMKYWKIPTSEYYKERYRRNIFEIIFNEKFPLKETLIPVCQRKFMFHVLGGVMF